MDDLEWFNHQLDSAKEFWRRVGAEVSDADVLDLGCGLGALTIDTAVRNKVVGLDIDPRVINFALGHIPKTYPDLSRRVEFVCADISHFTRNRFDAVISKDAFEHILDLSRVVSSIHMILKPGGRLVIGTSPLYYSPFGDHGARRIPWLTALVPERFLFRDGSAAAAGLNKMTPAEFRALFPSLRWDVVSIRYNAGLTGIAARAMNWLRAWSWLEKYFTVSIYTVMEKR